MNGRSGVSVGIVGAGPSGLLLSHVLSSHGIDNVVLERATRERVQARIRAGQIDYDTARYLVDIGVGHRLEREGIPQRGFNLRFGDEAVRINVEELTGGKYCVVYGQAELTKDLIGLRSEAGCAPVFEAEVRDIQQIDGAAPVIHYVKDGVPQELQCRFVVGCDGYYGVTRRIIQAQAGGEIETLMPYAWFGIFTRTPPIARELSYVYHRNGFALCSMRSASLSRIYLQCDPDDTIEDWDDQRFWEELFVRIGPDWASRFRAGDTLERTIVRMRSYVAGAMRHGPVFLVGDAAHIVPPSAAKGLNLAISDVHSLSGALAEWFGTGRHGCLDTYSDRALKRVWAMQDFSWLMTDLMHAPPSPTAFHDRLKIARLSNLVSSRESLVHFANQYVGLPL